MSVAVVDSTGKPDARLADLRFNFIGAFDECDNVKVKVVENTNSTEQRGDYDVKGTYFATYIRLSMDLVPESSVYFVSIQNKRQQFCKRVSCSFT